MLVPLIFTGIAYPMIGLRPTFNNFAIALGIVVLVANVATSFGKLHYDQLYPKHTEVICILIFFSPSFSTQDISYHVPAHQYQWRYQLDHH